MSVFPSEVNEKIQELNWTRELPQIVAGSMSERA